MPVKGKGYSEGFFNKPAPAGNTPNQKSDFVTRIGGNTPNAPSPPARRTGNIPVK